MRFAKAWREGRLNESVAYELSKLPKERQREAWDEYLRCGFGNPAAMSIKEAAAFCDGKEIFGHSAAPGNCVRIGHRRGRQLPQSAAEPLTAPSGREPLGTTILPALRATSLYTREVRGGEPYVAALPCR